MNLIERSKNIILNPKNEWDKISEEETTQGALLGSYVVPLALIPAIASFVGYGFIGYNAFLFKVSGVSWGIHHAVTSFAGSLLGVIITSFVVNALASNFGSQKNPVKAMQLVAYSFTPFWVAGILNILPSLSSLIALIGLYGIYLMYLGLPKLMKTPEDKVVIYLIVIIVVLIVVYLIISAILGTIIGSVVGLSMIR